MELELGKPCPWCGGFVNTAFILEDRGDEPDPYGDRPLDE